MASGDPKLKAFDFFKEAGVQLITLALGTVVFSATFYKDIVSGEPRHRWIVESSWIFFFLSILFGVGVLGALASELNEATEAKDLDIKDLDIYGDGKLPWYDRTVSWTAGGQLVTFLIAVVLFLAFAILNTPRAASNRLPTTTAANGPVTVTGPVTATGPLTVTGPLTATGAVSAAGPVTAMVPSTPPAASRLGVSAIDIAPIEYAAAGRPLLHVDGLIRVVESIAGVPHSGQREKQGPSRD